MTELRRQVISADDSPSIDAFGRWRVSEPFTLFDSKQIFDNAPYATGALTNTVTGGLEIDGGYLSTNLPVTQTTPNALRLGASIAGTLDTIVLCARAITNNITVEGSMTWRELS